MDPNNKNNCTEKKDENDTGKKVFEIVKKTAVIFFV
jgi:hypothetical protein